MHRTKEQGRVVIVTLGCSKNVVDSEHLGYHLAKGGWQVGYDEEPTPDDCLILNTCGFIGDAKKESIDYILRASHLRMQGKLRSLYVMGCLSERYMHELQQDIPEVDAWYGVQDGEALLRTLGVKGAPTVGQGRLLSTPPHVGYIKIAEGCNRGCAFCAIPSIRGPYRSASPEALVAEARALAEQGVRELMLVAQETSGYGYDLPHATSLATLIRALGQIEPLRWLRLHYAYPGQWSRDLTALFQEEPKLCHYLDIPVQHVHDTVLRTMHRGHTGRDVRDLITHLRSAVPDMALRTTLMVGYPSEGDAEFAELLHFVEEGHFAHLGVFCYSEEEGTPAAKHYPDTVPLEEKQARRAAIMEAQQSVAERFNQQLIGQELPVLLDASLPEDTAWLGRTPYDSYEVDGEVYIRCAPSAYSQLKAGDVVRVRIERAFEYDREGVLLGKWD